MKKIIALILALVFVGMLAGCGNDTAPTSTTTTSTISGNPSDSDNPNAPNTPPDDDDDIGFDDSNDDYQPVNPNYNAPTVEGVLGNDMNIFTSNDTFGNEGTISGYTTYNAQINMASYTGGKKCTIGSSGIYRVYGTTPNGQLEIKAKGQNVIVVLDNANITYLGSAPAIYSEDCASVTIILAENSLNSVQDSSVNTENGAIKVKNCNLTLGGKGKLTVTANGARAHGISNSKQLTIKGGNYEIKTNGHGVYGKESLTINGGKFKINSARSGFKSGNDGDGVEEDIQVGKIVINSCSANIRTHTNGINAYGSVEINNGRIEVAKADGKGIVATQNITINGGIIILSTKEDAIKSDAKVTIAGSSNIKIETNGNGIECVNAAVSTTGTIYIKTSPVYFEDKANGEYKLVDGKYVLLDGTEGANVKKYSVIECKGFEVENKLTISNGIIGINTFEDGMNATSIELSGGNMVISTQKDAVDASNADDTLGTITLSGKADVNIIFSNKGLKAAKNVNLNGGSTSIIATTDAIKASNVVVLLGTHILYEKVDCSKYSFTIKGGQFISIGTTEKPMGYQATVNNAAGAITNKDMCLAGQTLTITMGSINKTITLPKDYTEKMCVVVCDKEDGVCSVVIGNSQIEELAQGTILK